MFEWIKSRFTRKREIQRSSKERDRLTVDEQDLIRKNGHCPDCDGEMLIGPRGGMSRNYCCTQCHSEFNLTILQGAVLGERISDAGPREIGDRAWCYGIQQ